MKSSLLIWVGGGDQRKVVKIAEPEYYGTEIQIIAIIHLNLVLLTIQCLKMREEEQLNSRKHASSQQESTHPCARINIVRSRVPLLATDASGVNL
jgi:hypothetical protein